MYGKSLASMSYLFVPKRTGRNGDKMKKIKVLHILDKINVNSGVSAVVMNYYRNISSDKIEFDFIVHEQVGEELLSEITLRESRVYCMQPYSLKGIVNYSKEIRNILKETDYTIIHCHVPHEAFFCLREAEAMGIKHRIVHSHNSRGADKLFNRIRNILLTKLGLPYANEYLACSKSAADYAFGTNSIMRKKSINVLNAINVDQFKFDINRRNDLRDEFDINKYTVIGHVGRFSEQKNHLFLLRVFRQWKREVPESILVLVGTGKLEGVIKERVREYGLEDSVLFMQNRNDIPRILSMMDIFVLPSMYEGLPVVLIEAQASGLPCVISDSITNEAVVGDVTYAKINGGVQEWIKAMRIYWKDVKNMEKRQERSRSIRGSRFDIKTQTQKLEEFYEQLEKKE